MNKDKQPEMTTVVFKKEDAEARVKMLKRARDLLKKKQKRKRMRDS